MRYPKQLFIIIFIIFFIIFPLPCLADEMPDSYDAFGMSALEKYGDFKTVFKQAASGDISGALKALDPAKTLSAQLKEGLKIMRSLLFIGLLNGILALPGLGGGKGSEYMAFSVSYLLCAGLCLKALGKTINILAAFSEVYTGIFTAAVPVIAALLAVGGHTVFGSVSSMLTYSACTLLTHAIKVFILPCISFYAVCGVINCLSRQAPLTRLSKLIHGFVTFSMRAFGIIFGLVLTFEKAAAAGADGIVKKAAVSAVKAVPFVGDAFAAGADSVILMISSAKNSFAAALAVFAVTAFSLPLIKVFFITAAFRVSAALSEPFGDKKLSELIDTAGSASALVFSVMLCMTLIFLGALGILLLNFGG